MALGIAIGFVIGSMTGVCVMCLFQINKKH